MLVRTWSRDSFEIFKRNPTKTWHYILAPVTPRPQQNQWVMSRTKVRTVEDGFAQLKDELKMAKKETFLSKEVLTIGVVGAVALAVLTGHSPEMGNELSKLVTWGGAPVTIGGTFLVGSKLQAKRQEILRKHPMAYIYEYS
jgi:hypothetical protein